MRRTDRQADGVRGGMCICGSNIPFNCLSSKFVINENSPEEGEAQDPLQIHSNALNYFLVLIANAGPLAHGSVDGGGLSSNWMGALNLAEFRWLFLKWNYNSI